MWFISSTKGGSMRRFAVLTIAPLACCLAQVRIPGPGGSFSGSGGGSCASGYAHCRQLTIASGAVTSPLSNFSVLVQATLGSSRVRNANCYDVIFTTTEAGGTSIPWELQPAWCSQSTGAFYAFVNPGSVPTAGTTFWVQYDNTAISTAQNTGSYSPAQVYDANAQGVWHLGENAANTTITDSTGIQ